VPDNWPGGNVNTTFDPATQTWTQVFKPPDNKVNGGGDLNDITPFVVYKTGVDALPPSLKITLSLDLPVGVTEPSYFTGIAPAQRIRVFLPTRVDGSDIVCQAGDKGILGPVAANPDRSIRYENSVDFVQNPAVGATQLSYDRFKGKGRVVFGMEGIEFAALVDIRVALAIGPGADDIRHDRIRIKTTPFILAANTNKAVATIVSRSTGFPVFGGLFNFNNFLYTTSFDLLDQVPTITIPSADSNGDVWAQDEWEIGYIQAPRPGGAVRAMPVFLDLPRNRGLGNIALSQALNPNLGVFEGLKGSAALDAINYGGNIECSAPAAAGGVNYPLGRIMIGKSNPATEFHPSMNKKLHEFLYAQMVQPPMEVDSGWLDVGHIDEILGVVPVPATNSETASRIVVGSPKKAISIISAVTDNNTLIMAGDDFWQMTVGQFKANRRGLLTYNTALQGRIDSIIKQLKTDLGATVIEVPALYDREVSSYPAAWSSNTGTVRLVNYSVTNPANLPTNYTTWYVRFKNGLQFDVLYQAAEAAGGPMTLDGSGNRLVDYISLNGISIPMANWRGVAKKDDVIVFRTVQSAGPASAWLPGMQNAQVANSVVLAPFPYGPVIGGADMIVQAYQKALAGLGLSITYPLNEFFWYHQQLGEVHCSSNKISLPYRNPAQQWWKL
ncbi:MAG TPA: protein-arginine deiminase family protein, partial [Chthonomonadales bacterium]|nr:protein-arginine deiminase family protein [Chthonomonadales bacterium]